MATGDFNYYCEMCKQMYYNAHGCPIHGNKYPPKTFAESNEHATLKAERDRLREDYNAMREQINNVNKVYWEYDDWGDRAGEMKLSIEAILAIFPEIESEE